MAEATKLRLKQQRLTSKARTRFESMLKNFSKIEIVILPDDSLITSKYPEFESCLLQINSFKQY